MFSLFKTVENNPSSVGSVVCGAWRVLRSRVEPVSREWRSPCGGKGTEGTVDLEVGSGRTGRWLSFVLP